MTPIRTQDRLFLYLVVPMALAAGYVYFWRTSAVKEVESLKHTEASLVERDDFSHKRNMAAKRLADAAKALEQERKIPLPTSLFEPDADSVAGREMKVLEVFKTCGIITSSIAQQGEAEEAEEPANWATGLLSATGAVSEPTTRTYVLKGSYPQILKALKVLDSQHRPVIPVGLNLTRPNRWTIQICL